MARLGIDLGGTKIAGVVLAADGRALWETPRAHAAPGLRCDGRGDSPARGVGRGVCRGTPARWALACPARFRPRRASSRTPTRPGSTAARFRSISNARLAGRSGSPTTRTAWRCQRPLTARRPAREVVFGVIVGHGHGRRHCRARVGADGRQRHRRRVGAQSAAVAAGGRAARARRATAAGTAVSRPGCPAPGWRLTTRAAVARLRAAEEVVARARARRSPGAAPVWTRGPIVSRADSRRSSTSSTPM